VGIYSLPGLGYETNGYGNGYALDESLERLGFGSAICNVGRDDGSDDGPFRSASDANLCRSAPKTPRTASSVRAHSGLSYGLLAGLDWI
jgi:hypothetical protein